MQKGFTIFVKMKRLIFILLVPAVLLSCGPRHLEEFGEWGAWEFREVGSSSYHRAEVPGCIHTDLLANGLIEDPFFGENEKDLQWIGETEWEYITAFTPGAGILAKDNVELVFEGLDTYAEVYLNEKLILRADNMFRTWTVDVKDILTDARNELKLVFSPPAEINSQKAEALPYRLPDDRAFTRKSPYHFGWDWGPVYITGGIWKPLHLRAWDNFRIERVHVSYDSVRMDSMPLKIHVEVDSDREQDTRIMVFDETSGERKAFEKVSLSRGRNLLQLNAAIAYPRLWWPHGLGEQELYTFRVRMVGGGTRDEHETTFGIRSIELVMQPDEAGESFYFMVNGLPVFMKGANYVPQDNFLPRVDTARYVKLISSVVDANMNMLRVWGGGIYENDLFYELCDRQGILVWQDFMFACNMYPGDEQFLENVKQEAIDNVSRLSNHPCIALWCGNNEIDEGWHNWGWQESLNYSAADSARVWHDYLHLFHELLPAVVSEYDPGTAYRPSSPMTGWGREEAYTRGDIHYWGVWWGEEPFEMYREKIGRFVSEYGFQGMPPLETIRSFGGVSCPRPSSPVPHPRILEAHQKHPRGTQLIQQYMERDFVVPEKFEDYVYISQVLQAEGMGKAFYSHRLANPFCMGTLYWQLNDCWPVTSWSGLDYYGRWKALHYHVKRAYAPLMVKAVENEGGIEVFAVNDHREPQLTVLDFSLEDFSGEKLSAGKRIDTIPPLSVRHIHSFRLPELDMSRHVFIAKLFRGDSLVSGSFLYLEPNRGLVLEDPGLSIDVTEGAGGPLVIVRSEKLARQVFLEAKGLEGSFSDNFFDMAAGETRKILYLGEANAMQLAEKLSIKSIYETYN
jgi:beta-mannosidase